MAPPVIAERVVAEEAPPRAHARTTWRVATTNSGKLTTWTSHHRRGGRCRRARDVSSTARRSQKPTTPHSTAVGCHELANGTSRSASPKWVYESATRAARWTPTKMVPRPPNQRCRSSSQVGRGRRPRARVVRARPSTMELVRRA
jgi:hypothetical protein